MRYFTLRDATLSYFIDNEGHERTSPKGTFHVLSIARIEHRPHKVQNGRRQVSSLPTKQHIVLIPRTQYRREIVFPNRSLVLGCEEDDILNQWYGLGLGQSTLLETYSQLTLCEATPLTLTLTLTLSGSLPSGSTFVGPARQIT